MVELSEQGEEVMVPVKRAKGALEEEDHLKDRDQEGHFDPVIITQEAKTQEQNKSGINLVEVVVSTIEKVLEEQAIDQQVHWEIDQREPEIDLQVPWADTMIMQVLNQEDHQLVALKEKVTNLHLEKEVSGQQENQEVSKEDSSHKQTQ